MSLVARLATLRKYVPRQVTCMVVLQKFQTKDSIGSFVFLFRDATATTNCTCLFVRIRMQVAQLMVHEEKMRLLTSLTINERAIR